MARSLLRPVIASIDRPKRLVASAARLQTPVSDAGARRTRLPWQERAFAYYELLGEIWYASQFYARALQKLELRMVRRVGQDEFEEVSDPDLLDYLDRIQDAGGGRSNLMGAYGRLKFLTGECYLLVTNTDLSDVVEEGATPGGGEVWEMLSCDELRWDRDAGRYLRYRLPNGQPEVLPETPAGEWEPIGDSAIAWRFWSRHPRYSSLADAPMRGVLDLCEELVILTRAVRARGRSRLAGSGILFVPDEVTFPADTATVPDEDPGADVFLDRLTESMIAGISDEGSAGAVVPLVLRVGEQFIEKFRHLQIIDPMQIYPETGLRMECIQRIAIGLDLPPEILLGKADANHWSAWQIDEDSWKAHLQPVAQALCDDLTGGYLRPSMRADGVADWESYGIAYDATAIINHPDRGRDAKDLHDRLVISDEALRDAAGFDDDDAPEEEEYNRRVGVKLNQPALAIEGTLPDAPEPAPAAPIVGPPAPGGAPGPGAVEPGTPEPPGDEAAGEPAAEVASIPTPIRLASELVSERARELAGSRIRSRFANNRRVARILDGVANRDVGGVIAKHLNGEMGDLLDERHNLVAGGGECFRPRLLSWGLGAGDVEMVIATAEQHAAETLFDAVGD